MAFDDESSSNTDSDLDISDMEDVQLLLEPSIPPAPDLSAQQLREVSFTFISIFVLIRPPSHSVCPF